MAGPVPNHGRQRSLAIHIHRGDNGCHDSMVCFPVKGEEEPMTIEGAIVDVLPANFSILAGFVVAHGLQSATGAMFAAARHQWTTDGAAEVGESKTRFLTQKRVLP